MPNHVSHSYTAAELAGLLKKQAADRIVKPHAHAAIHHWDTWESAVEGTLEWQAAEFLMRQVGPSDEDKRDAARYRWLRDNEDIYCGGRVRGVFWIRDDLDAAIDKEMDKSSPLATTGGNK